MAANEDRRYLRDNLLDENDPSPVDVPQPPRRKGTFLQKIASQVAVPPPSAPAPQDYVHPQNPFMEHAPPPPQQYARPENAHPQDPANARHIIAIDYGTTYTGFAYATTSSDEPNLKEIKVMRNWGANTNNQWKVRSLISYSKPVNGEAQWGSELSMKAITMVNTKLELEPRDTLIDELDLTLHLLKGTKALAFKKLPKDSSDAEYPCKSPTEIVTDYLTKVYERVQEKIGFQNLAQTKTPVDIVITVPVNWSYQATNSTFKAFRNAGFNKTNFPTLKDTILVSEPEAASYFTARDSQTGATEFLGVDDCFLVCDAGGGTVDVVTLRVKRTKSYLELEQATKPTSDKCGSTFIDAAFKDWLRKVLGDEKYGKIDPANVHGRFSAHMTESGPMRELMRGFEEMKRGFSTASSDITLDLPAPLNRLTIEGRVDDGEITLYRNEMRALFNKCVNRVVGLIEGQIEKAQSDGERVKNLFLVGGFGASPYLQEALKRSLDKRNVKMRRPDPNNSWTAVVQGAVIYGMEKYRHKDVNCMYATEKSYGIVLNGRYQWLLRKGDVILSKQKRAVCSEPFSIPRDHARDYALPIYMYEGVDDDNVPEIYPVGKREVKQAGVVRCDLSKILNRHLDAVHKHGNANSWGTNIGPFTCHFQLSRTLLEVELRFCREIVAGRIQIRLADRQPQTSSNGYWSD